MKIKIATAVLLAAAYAFGQYSGGGGVTSAQLATKLSISNITPTVTSDTNTVPSNQAVEDALDGKVDDLGDYWTIAFFGDTHLSWDWSTNAWYSDYANSCQWIVDNAQSENIKIVLHSGDMIDIDSTNEVPLSGGMWTGASNAFSRIRSAGIPFLFTSGNHDYSDGDGWTNGGTTRMAEFFPASSFTNENYFHSSMTEGDVENVAYKMSIGNVSYLFISAKVFPSTNELNWVQSVCDSNKGSRIIFVTHAYLSNTGTIPSGNAELIYDYMLSGEFNATFSGHDHLDYARLKRSTGERVCQQIKPYLATTPRLTNVIVNLLRVYETTKRADLYRYIPSTAELTKVDSFSWGENIRTVWQDYFGTVSPISLLAIESSNFRAPCATNVNGVADYIMPWNALRVNNHLYFGGSDTNYGVRVSAAVTRITATTTALTSLSGSSDNVAATNKTFVQSYEIPVSGNLPATYRVSLVAPNDGSAFVTNRAWITGVSFEVPETEY